MSVNVLICDDSGFARRAMARSLPDGWDINISFAEHGQEALDKIGQGLGDVLFLDLNMPVLDGYQTMQRIRELDLPTMVIVVSGDVQEEARKRMKNLGAIDFIRKPIDNLKLSSILAQYGLYNGEASAKNRQKQIAATTTTTDDDKLDAFRELANVAMGQAGESLAKLLGVFVNLPIPNVSVLHHNELHMALAEIKQNEKMSAVSKGFVSAGINGEALILFNEANAQNMIKLLGYSQNQSSNEELEVLMDVSNILIGACLNALSKQLNVKFTHNHPIILGIHCGLDVILSQSSARWNKILAIEIAYSISSHDINFELLVLIPDKDIDKVFLRLVDNQE